jgi:hypothetical protein
VPTHLFKKVIKDVEGYDQYFTAKPNAIGRLGVLGMDAGVCGANTNP